MIALPAMGDVLAHGSQAHDGTPNVCRVLRVRPDVSDGFLAVFVNPAATRERRLPTDRPFWVWTDSPEHARMQPYRGLADRHHAAPAFAGQLTLTTTNGDHPA